MRISKEKYQIAYGYNLERIMKRLGYSQKRLAEETGIRQPTLSAYIYGKYCPSITSTIAIAQTLKVDYKTLLDADCSAPIERRYDFFNEPISEVRWARDFGMAFRTMLRREQCSQTELADATGITQGMISKYLRGFTIPSTYAIASILEYLCVIEGYDDLLELGLVIIER